MQINTKGLTNKQAKKKKTSTYKAQYTNGGQEKLAILSSKLDIIVHLLSIKTRHLLIEAQPGFETWYVQIPV